MDVGEIYEFVGENIPAIFNAVEDEFKRSGGSEEDVGFMILQAISRMHIFYAHVMAMEEDDVRRASYIKAHEIALAQTSVDVAKIYGTSLQS